MYLGRFEEGIAEAKRARELDPLSLAFNNALGGRLLLARRDNAAIEQIQKTLEMDPNFAPAHNRLGWAYLRNGTYEQAIAEFQKAMALSESDPDFFMDLGYAYAVAGNRDEAQTILAELKRKRERGFVSSSALAIVYGALGEKDEAFAWLEKAYEERDPQLTYLKVGPRFDPLRRDPRFKEVLRRVGLADKLPHPTPPISMQGLSRSESDRWPHNVRPVRRRKVTFLRHFVSYFWSVRLSEANTL